MRRRMVDELGFVSVKMLAPTVVAPRLVRAPEAEVAPVPPMAIARAFVSERLVIEVVARVDVAKTLKVPVTEVLARLEVPATVRRPEFVVLPKLERPVKVGAYEKTATPLFVEPVSSERRALSWAEFENGVARPRVVVAT